MVWDQEESSERKAGEGGRRSLLLLLNPLCCSLANHLFGFEHIDLIGHQTSWPLCPSHHNSLGPFNVKTHWSHIINYLSSYCPTLSVAPWPISCLDLNASLSLVTKHHDFLAQASTTVLGSFTTKTHWNSLLHVIWTDIVIWKLNSL